ncbi:ankyrin repeat and death domain-containing protein [Anaeramoeba flamelloides]|uniref:Ankyrin repeat and death domain-containing protein n=1 Tax=Anaeramoeba flamelloides TaxID=1746091 RepID=A0ABQ8YFE2_9EUKA|nr:ankyrin repeat and death domain-containing protein [Anaeramoeba flamelloides]
MTAHKFYFEDQFNLISDIDFINFLGFRDLSADFKKPKQKNNTKSKKQKKNQSHTFQFEIHQQDTITLQIEDSSSQFLVNSNEKNTEGLFIYYCKTESIDEKFISKMYDNNFQFQDFNCQNKFGVTPLMVLCQNPTINPKILGCLFESGVDFFLQDKKERNCFHYLLKNKNENNLFYDLVQYFGTQFRDIFFNIRDHKSKTPLMYFCASKFLTKKNLLLFLNYQQMDLNVQDSKGKTALHYLFANGSLDLEIIKIFLKSYQGGYQFLKDNHGHTAFHYLLENQIYSTKIFEYLLLNHSLRQKISQIKTIKNKNTNKSKNKNKGKNKRKNNNNNKNKNKNNNKNNNKNKNEKYQSLMIFDLLFTLPNINQEIISLFICYCLNEEDPKKFEQFISLFLSTSKIDLEILKVVTTLNLEQFQTMINLNAIKYFEQCFLNPSITKEIIEYLFDNFVKDKHDNTLNWELFLLCLEKIDFKQCLKICTIFLPYDFDLEIFDNLNLKIGYNETQINNKNKHKTNNNYKKTVVLKRILLLSCLKEGKIDFNFLDQIINLGTNAGIVFSKTILLINKKLKYWRTLFQQICFKTQNLHLIEFIFNKNPNLIKECELQNSMRKDQWGEYLLIHLLTKLMKICYSFTNKRQRKNEMNRKKKENKYICGMEKKEKNGVNVLKQINLKENQSQIIKKFEKIIKKIDHLNINKKNYKKFLNKSQVQKNTDKITNILHIIVYLQGVGAKLSDHYGNLFKWDLIDPLFNINNSIEKDFTSFYNYLQENDIDLNTNEFHKQMIELRTKIPFQDVNDILRKSNNEEHEKIFYDWVYGDFNSKDLLKCKYIFKQLKLVNPKQSSLKSDLKDLYQTKKSKNFTYFLKNNEKIIIHKFLLFIRTPTLLNMFKITNEYQNNHLKDYGKFDKIIFQIFFKFLYTNKFNYKLINKNNIDQIIDLVHLFNRKDAKRLKFLKFTLVYRNFI